MPNFPLPNLPKVDGLAFSTTLIKRRIARKIHDTIDYYGNEPIKLLLEKNRPIKELFKTNGDIEFIKQQLARYKVHAIFTNKELYDTLPEWTKELIQSYGEQGDTWINEQLTWLRSIVE